MAASLQVHIRQTSDSTSEASIRQHQVLIDRPQAKGGADAGPMGGELFLASVGGCFMSNLLAASKARDRTIDGVLIEVTGELASAPDRFVAIELAVSAANGDPDILDKLVEIAGRGCIMMNTLRGHLDLRTRVVQTPSTAMPAPFYETSQ